MVLHKELVILYDSGFLSPTILSDKLTSYVIWSMLQASLKYPKKLQFRCGNLCNSKRKLWDDGVSVPVPLSLFLSFSLEILLLPLKHNLSFGQDGNGVEGC